MILIIKKYKNLRVNSMSLFSSTSYQFDFFQFESTSYSSKIASVFFSNCTYSSCHNDTYAIEFKLQNHKEVMRFGSMKTGHPEKSDLYETLKSLKSNIVMPKPPYNKLFDTQIELIYNWIGQGALNN